MKPLDRALPHEEAARATDAVVRPAQPGRQSRPPDYLRGWTKFSGWDDFAGGDPETLSERRIADYKPFTMVDGEGVRCSLYVSGCLFDCPGCFNLAAQSFKYGTPYTVELEDRILADLSQPFVQGLSLLGGEPFQNSALCLSLVERVRKEAPGKDVWAWTGYTFEWLFEHGSWTQTRLLEQVDVLVDGPFIQEQKDLSLAFRGSRNQRIIDVAASLKAQKSGRWQKNHRAGAVVAWQPS